MKKSIIKKITKRERGPPAFVQSEQKLRCKESKKQRE